MSHDEGLVKVVVDLPNHWGASGESMWAKPLGNDQFEIRNIPFFAYGLNFGDVVHAKEPTPEMKPVVAGLIRSGGHRTLRVFFGDTASAAECLNRMRELESTHVGWEGAGARHFAVDIHPAGDYESVCQQLETWLEAGIVEYETCEPRLPGSFDADPADNNEGALKQ